MGVETFCRFVWEFHGDAIIVSFGVTWVFFLESKNAFAFACAAALAFATSADFKSDASFSYFARCKRLVSDLAPFTANSVDFFLLGFVILDGLDILSMLLLLKVCLDICECYCVNVVRIM